MNKTSIEWTNYTWNPVSGCKHKCKDEYCYNTMKTNSLLNRFGAQYIDENGIKQSEKNWRSRETGENHIAKEKEIYPYGYDPTFYPHRLKEPRKKGRGRVFVVNVGDLFGRWVPQEWIEQVLEVVKLRQNYTFQFLTKNPNRYLEFEFPINAWVGTTVNSDNDAPRAEIIKRVSAPVRYLSIEPLLGPITFDLAGSNWIILGAQTGENPVIPEKEWIDGVIKESKRLGIPLFMKHNIRAHSTTFVQEIPDGKPLPSLGDDKNRLREKALALLDTGMSSQEVAHELGMKLGQVGAYKAHRTMGTYGNTPQPGNGNKPAIETLTSIERGFDTNIVDKRVRVILDLSTAMAQEIDIFCSEIGVDREALIKMWLHERIRSEKQCRHCGADQPDRRRDFLSRYEPVNG